LIRQINELDSRRKNKKQGEISGQWSYPRTMSARAKRSRSPQRAGYAMERRMKLEARLAEVERQIKLARKAA
jgi:hypothetical protein